MATNSLCKDGLLDEYKSHNISQEQELIWRVELKENLHSQLEIKHGSSSNGLQLIINYFGDYDLLDRLVNYILINYNQADSFLKLRYAEDFFDVLKKCEFHNQCPNQSLTKTKDLILVLIDDVLEKEIIIIKKNQKKS